MIALNLPFRKIPCEILNDNTVCDQEMLSKLSELNINKQSINEESNPLWEGLNKLKKLN
jgi:hypothetical protein